MLGKLTNDEALLVLGTLRRVATAMRLHPSLTRLPAAGSRCRPAACGRAGTAAEPLNAGPPGGYPVVQGEQQGRRA